MAKPRIFGLTPNQQIFVDEWLIDRNSTRAYKIAYPKIKKDATAAASATRLLKNVKVQAYIAKGLEKMETRSEATRERIITEYARVGFFDVRKLFNGDGSPKPVDELDDDIAAVIASIDVQEVWEGHGDARRFLGYIKKYRLADKVRALDAMAKIKGMFVEKHEITGKDGGPLETASMTEAQMLELIRKVAGKSD